MLYAPSAHDSYPGTQKRRISGKDDFAVSRLSSTWPNVGFRAAAAASPPPPQAEVTHSWHLPGPHPTSCKVGTSGWRVRTPCEAVCTLLRTSMASQVLLGFRVYKLYYSHFHEQMVLQNCSNFQPSSLPFFKRFARCNCGWEYKKKEKGLQLFWTFSCPANWSEGSPCQSDWGCWSIYLSIYVLSFKRGEDWRLNSLGCMKKTLNNL